MSQCAARRERTAWPLIPAPFVGFGRAPRAGVTLPPGFPKGASEFSAPNPGIRPRYGFHLTFRSQGDPDQPPRFSESSITRGASQDEPAVPRRRVRRRRKQGISYAATAPSLPAKELETARTTQWLIRFPHRRQAAFTQSRVRDKTPMIHIGGRIPPVACDGFVPSGGIPQGDALAEGIRESPCLKPRNSMDQTGPPQRRRCVAFRTGRGRSRRPHRRCSAPAGPIGGSPDARPCSRDGRITEGPRRRLRPGEKQSGKIPAPPGNSPCRERSKTGQTLIAVPTGRASPSESESHFALGRWRAAAIMAGL